MTVSFQEDPSRWAIPQDPSKNAIDVVVVVVVVVVLSI